MKYLKDKYALFLASAIALCMTLVPVAANAVVVPPDFSTLTAAVDLSTVIVAILAIAAILAGVYVAIKGAKTVIGMIKGG